MLQASLLLLLLLMIVITRTLAYELSIAKYIIILAAIRNSLYRPTLIVQSIQEAKWRVIILLNHECVGGR